MKSQNAVGLFLLGGLAMFIVGCSATKEIPPPVFPTLTEPVVIKDHITIFDGGTLNVTFVDAAGKTVKVTYPHQYNFPRRFSVREEGGKSLVISIGSAEEDRILSVFKQNHKRNKQDYTEILTAVAVERVFQCDPNLAREREAIRDRSNELRAQLKHIEETTSDEELGSDRWRKRYVPVADELDKLDPKWEAVQARAKIKAGEIPWSSDDE